MYEFRIYEKMAKLAEERTEMLVMAALLAPPSGSSYSTYI